MGKKMGMKRRKLDTKKAEVGAVGGCEHKVTEGRWGFFIPEKVLVWSAQSCKGAEGQNNELTWSQAAVTLKAKEKITFSINLKYQFGLNVQNCHE